MTSDKTRITWKDLPREELDKQINPIYYGASRAPENVLTEWRKSVIGWTAKSRAYFKCAFNIEYGPGELQKYDVYGVDLPEDAPIFIFIHGGAWQTGSKDRTGHFPLMNQHNGFRSIAVAYTLAPAATIAKMQAEIFTALKKITTDYPRAKIFVAGHSAGAQLAANLLHASPAELPVEVMRKIAGLILISGVFDLRAIVSTYINDVVKIGMEDAAALSPMLRPFGTGIDQKSLKILVTFGGKESDEFHRQSLHYYDKLKEVFPQATLWTSPADDHFTIIENMATVESAISQTILQFLQ